jgi:glycosyltransferase involved in cell wall biosynthesis
VKIALLAQAGSAHTRRWSLALAARGHQVRILSHGQIGVAPPGITTIFLPGSSRAAYFLNIIRVRRLLKSFAPDVVHAHFATGYGLWGSCQTTAPLVLSIWGTDVEDALAHRLTVAPIVRRAFKKAGIITAPSRFLLDRAVLVEPSIRARMRLVPFGVNIPQARTERAGSRTDTTIKIIFAKAYLPDYAPDLVLEAFATAFREYPHLSLTMLGGGPLRDALETQAASLGITAAVTFHDRVEMDESIRRIGESDIMVMPSRREAFGVAAVEAAACGLPVIATKVGGIPEIVQDGTSGILISPDDRQALSQAILRLATDRELRVAMGQAGRKIAEERFDLNRNLNQMEALYREVLSAS